MPDFKRNDRFQKGPRGGFGEKRMYDATCANCGKVTQVPFKPNGMKPVYCRDCFKPEGDRGPREGGFERRGSFEKRGGFEKKSFGPRRDFAPREARPDGRIDDLKRQMDAMNATLERLANSVGSLERTLSLGNEVRRVAETAEKPAKAKAKKPAKKATKKK
jgi:CxxC-x17-CxxC domain-containing protein